MILKLYSIQISKVQFRPPIIKEKTLFLLEGLDFY